MEVRELKYTAPKILQETINFSEGIVFVDAVILLANSAGGGTFFSGGA